jgi:hypothetical protein
LEQHQSSIANLQNERANAFGCCGAFSARDSLYEGKMIEQELNGGGDVD